MEHILSLEAFQSRPQLVVDVGQEDHDHDDHEPHDHFRGVTSISILLPILEKRQEEAFDVWLRELLWERWGQEESEKDTIGVLRTKGYYWTSSGEQVVIQGVRHLYDTQRIPAGGAPDYRGGKLVLIGKGLTEALRLDLNRVLSET